MLRRSFAAFVRFTPVSAVPLNRTPDEAAAAVRQLYESRWLGASSQFLSYQSPRHHFVPFYLCSGTAKGTYTAEVDYSQTARNDKGEQTSSTTTTVLPAATGQVPLLAHDKRMQIYAGYRRDTKHVSCLLGEHLPGLMRPRSEVDLAAADDVNLFELSERGVAQTVERRAREAFEMQAVETLRAHNPTASAVRVTTVDFTVKIKRAVPLYVPAYVVKVDYDSRSYDIVVCGVRGECRGPYLYNPETVGRLAGMAALAGAALLAKFYSPVSAMAAATIGFSGAYYSAFYGSRMLPQWKIDGRRRRQEASRAADQSRGGPAGSDSGERRRTRVEDEGSDAHRRSRVGVDDRKTGRQFCDPTGHYATLGLRGDESLNELRAAFHREALRSHPDAGGTDDRMARVNQAYQVLRDPRRRRRYDGGDRNA